MVVLDPMDDMGIEINKNRSRGAKAKKDYPKKIFQQYRCIGLAWHYGVSDRCITAVNYADKKIKRPD